MSDPGDILKIDGDKVDQTSEVRSRLLAMVGKPSSKRRGVDGEGIGGRWPSRVRALWITRIDKKKARAVGWIKSEVGSSLSAADQRV